MKKVLDKLVLLLLLISAVGSIGSCTDSPVDEDGLLITTREECYVSNFNLLGSDHQTILLGTAYVDTLAQVVVGYVRYGANISYVWPQVTLCEDAKLDPKITGWTDFSGSKMSFNYIDGDWTAAGIPNAQLGQRVVENKSSFPSTAMKYSVISGTRKIKKEYTFIILERPLQ